MTTSALELLGDQKVTKKTTSKKKEEKPEVPLESGILSSVIKIKQKTNSSIDSINFQELQELFEKYDSFIPSPTDNGSWRFLYEYRTDSKNIYETRSTYKDRNLKPHLTSDIFSLCIVLKSSNDIKICLTPKAPDHSLRYEYLERIETCFKTPEIVVISSEKATNDAIEEAKENLDDVSKEGFKLLEKDGTQLGLQNNAYILEQDIRNLGPSNDIQVIYKYKTDIISETRIEVMSEDFMQNVFNFVKRCKAKEQVVALKQKHKDALKELEAIENNLSQEYIIELFKEYDYRLEKKLRLKFDKFIFPRLKTNNIGKILNVEEKTIDGITYRRADLKDRSFYVSENHPIYNRIDKNNYLIGCELLMASSGKNITKKRHSYTYIAHESISQFVIDDNLIKELSAFGRTDLAPLSAAYPEGSDCYHKYLSEADVKRFSLYLRRKNAPQITQQDIEKQIEDKTVRLFHKGIENVLPKGKSFDFSAYGGADVMTIGPDSIKFQDQELKSTNFKTSSDFKLINDLKKRLQLIVDNTKSENSKHIISSIFSNRRPFLRIKEIIKNTRIPEKPIQKEKEQDHHYKYRLASYSQEIKIVKDTLSIIKNSGVVKLALEVSKTHDKLYLFGPAFNIFYVNNRDYDQSSPNFGRAFPSFTRDTLNFNDIHQRFVSCICNEYHREVIDKHPLYTFDKKDYEKTFFTATLGEVKATLKIKSAKSIVTYINNYRVRQDEVVPILLKSICFEEQSQFDAFIKSVSKLSLRARTLLSKGIDIKLVENTNSYKNKIDVSVILEFDKTNDGWFLVIRDYDGKKIKSHKLTGAITKFANMAFDNFIYKRQSAMTINNFIDKLSAFPTLGIESVTKIIDVGTKLLDDRLARSRKLLEDAAVKSKAEFTTITTPTGKSITGYVVQGTSGTKYIIACSKKSIEYRDTHGNDDIGNVYTLPDLRYVCIVDKGDDQYGYDIVAGRIRALRFDQLIARHVTTLAPHV